jgi:AcrR family transcriptional regulator
LSHPSEPLHCIRPQRQTRTQEGLERLLDAAETLFAEKYFEEVHVAELVSRTGISLGAFHRRFGDKVGLLHAVHERLIEEALFTAEHALAASRWEGAGTRQVLEGVVPFLIRILKERQALGLAVLQRGVADAEMRERSVRLIRHVVEGLSRLFLERRAEIGHPEPERAVVFASMQIFSLLTYTYTAGSRDSTHSRMSDAVIARELVEFCLAYLLIGVEH